MSRKRILDLIFVVLFLLVLMPSLSSAAATTGLVPIVPCGNDGQTPCSVCDLAQLAQNILNDGIYIAVFLSAVLFAWAGVKLLTSVSNSGERTRAKEIFTNVAIGLVIILASWLVVDTVMRTLVGASFGPWNSIC